MKQIIIALALIVGFSTNIFANASKEKEVSTKVKEVIIFKNACQITRNQTVELEKGANVLKFSGLSPYLDESSVRIKMDKEAVILSVNFQLNYEKNNDKKEQQLNVFKDEIKKIEEQIVVEQTNKTVVNDELAFFASNMHIAGADGIQPAQIKEIHQFYSKKISELRLSALEIDKRIKQLQEEKFNIGEKYSKLSTEDIYPEGELYVKLDVNKADKYMFNISYIASNASWEPSYDIVAKNINSPIELVYKAEVKQNTKEDWKDVKVKLSSSNPKKVTGKTKLRPYHLNFNYRGFDYSSEFAVSSGSGTISGKVIDQTTKQAIPFVNIIVTDNNNKQIASATANVDGIYNIKLVPSGVYSVRASSVGYQTQTIKNVTVASSKINFANIGMKPETTDRGMFEIVEYEVPLVQKDKTTVGGTMSKNEIDRMPEKSTYAGGVFSRDGDVGNIRGQRSGAGNPNEYRNVSQIVPIENDTYFEFEIKSPYTIPSDGKNYTILINEFSIPTTYTYFTVPKIDPEAYLIAEMTNWSAYNLISGNSSVFFDNTFIGKSFIDTHNTSDTLEIFLGKDNGIVVKRELEQSTSSSSIIGNKQEEVKTWKISLRNNKNYAISLLVYDQVPIPTDDEISVKNINLSGGNVDEKSGEVSWNLKLSPSEVKTLELKYSVKYPNYRRLYFD